MPLAMSRPWKHPNSGVFWLRRRVPDDLRQLVGKREEKQSLRTRDPQEAKRRHVQLMTELDARWQNLRAGPRTITEREAHEIAAVVYDHWVAHHAENPSDQKFWDVRIGEKLWAKDPLPDITGKSFLEIVMEADPDFSKKSEMQEWCMSQADDALASRGLANTPGNKNKMAFAISAAIQKASFTLTRYATGDFSFRPGPSTQSAKSQIGPGKKVTFKALFDGWVAEKSPSEKTRYSWERVLKQLAAFLGHDDASRLAPEDLIRWKTALLNSGLKTKTIRDGKLAPVRAILQWGADNRHLSQNAGERVTIDLKAKLIDRKRGYSEEEARTVLRAALKQPDSFQRWVPWLCAYTGARVSEVCQLRAEDIAQIENTWCLRFSPEAGSLKNANSERTVPLHGALIKQGFLKYAKKVRSGPLFIKLTPDRFGSRGGNGARILGRWVRSLGIEDPRISPNHSWRHRFKTLARRHGMATDIVDAIVGHRRRTVADGYGEFPVEALLRELSKLPAAI